MTKLRKLWCVGLIATLTFVSACNDDAKPDDAQPTDSAETSEPTWTSQTSTNPTLRPDDYAVPAVIEAKYVDRVLAALNHVDGDALRLAIKENNLTKDVTDRLTAISTADWLEFPLGDYSQLQINGWASIKPNPGDRVVTSQDIPIARSDCVLVHATEDSSARLVQPIGPLDVYIVLAPADPALDPRDFNPTPWAISRKFLAITLEDTPENVRCGG